METHKHHMWDLHGHHGQVFNLTAALVFNSVHPQATNNLSRFSIILFFFFFQMKPNSYTRKKLQAPPCSLHLQILTESYQDVSLLLPSAAAGTVRFQSFLNTELQTPGTIKSNKISWETKWQCLNDAFSSGMHSDFATRPLSVSNPLQGARLFHKEWNSEVGLKVALSKANQVPKYHLETKHALIKQLGSVQQPESQSNLRSTSIISKLALPQETKMRLHPLGDTLWGQFFALEIHELVLLCHSLPFPWLKILKRDFKSYTLIQNCITTKKKREN